MRQSCILEEVQYVSQNDENIGITWVATNEEQSFISRIDQREVTRSPTAYSSISIVSGR